MCVNQIKVFKQNIPKKLIEEECILDNPDEIYSDDYIDEIGIQESYIIDKLKILNSQKKEEYDLLDQINKRIKLIEEEINKLKQNKIFN